MEMYIHRKTRIYSSFCEDDCKESESKYTYTKKTTKRNRLYTIFFPTFDIFFVYSHTPVTFSAYIGGHFVDIGDEAFVVSKRVKNLLLSLPNDEPECVVECSSFYCWSLYHFSEP